jgi:hypothetical protein
MGVSVDAGKARRFNARRAVRNAARVAAAEAIEHALIHSTPNPPVEKEMRRIARQLRQRGERQ